MRLQLKSLVARTLVGVVLGGALTVAARPASFAADDVDPAPSTEPAAEDESSADASPAEDEAEHDAAPAAAPRAIRVGVASQIAVYDDTDHVAVATPSVTGTLENPVAGWSVKGRYLVDVVSAASVDIVSTASSRWHEIRHAGSLGGQYKPGLYGAGVDASFSSEPDYLSWTVGGRGLVDLDDKNKALVFGFAHGHDIIGRTGTPFDVFSRTLDRNALDVGMTFVVDRSTLFALTGDAIYERGDSSKPYRYVPMFQPGAYQQLPAGSSIDQVNALRLPEKPLEQLPLARDRYAVTGRIAHRFDTSTLRVSERLYTDSWGLKASTTDLTWIADVTDSWSLSPHLRLHGQLPVVFWKRVYAATFDRTAQWAFPALRTGDRELGGLETLTLGMGSRWDLGSVFDVGQWALSSQVEGMFTHFDDALYITTRLAIFGAIGVEVAL